MVEVCGEIAELAAKTRAVRMLGPGDKASVSREGWDGGYAQVRCGVFGRAALGVLDQDEG